MFSRRKADMSISNFLLITLLILKCDCDPRTPRVYNVLITSKKNLAPSQALPVYEPVLRTTSLGLAFPPFIYTDLSSADHQPRYIPEAPLPERNIIMQPSEAPQPPPIQHQQSYGRPRENVRNLPSNVVSLEQFVPLYTPHFTYQQYLPREAQKFEQPQAQQNNNYERIYNEERKEQQIVANFRRNPDIPDVPPPPLPVRNN